MHARATKKQMEMGHAAVLKLDDGEVIDVSVSSTQSRNESPKGPRDSLHTRRGIGVAGKREGHEPGGSGKESGTQPG